MVVQRLPENPIYHWDLNEDNHTRFDYPRAIPAEHELRTQFTVLAIINGFVSVTCLIIVVAILRHRIVRQNGFNLYLFFIALPDFLNSFFCMITCAMSAPRSSYYSNVMCGFQSFYLVWGYTANCWMNGVIVYQIHKLLRYSRARRRYLPPSRKQATTHACLVYLYATFLGFLGVWNIHWLPLKTSAFYGLACFPIEYDLGSTVFWWLVFAPAFLILPVIYVVYVIFDIWRAKLLPRVGRRRNLSLYFFRLILVYLFMWTPSLATCLVGNFVKLSPWVYWSGAALSHFQGIASSLAMLTKQDIREAVLVLLTCQKVEEPIYERNLQQASTRTSESARISLLLSFRNWLSSRGRLEGTAAEESVLKQEVSSNATKGILADAVRYVPRSSHTVSMTNQNGDDEGGVEEEEEEEDETKVSRKESEGAATSSLEIDEYLSSFDFQARPRQQSGPSSRPFSLFKRPLISLPFGGHEELKESVSDDSKEQHLEIEGSGEIVHSMEDVSDDAVSSGGGSKNGDLEGEARAENGHENDEDSSNGRAPTNSFELEDHDHSTDENVDLVASSRVQIDEDDPDFSESSDGTIRA